MLASTSTYGVQGSGTSPLTSRSGPSPTRRLASGWYSARMARCWRPAAMAAPRNCGTRLLFSRSGVPLAAHKPGSPVTFSRDGKMLAIAADDGTVRLWDVVTHQQIGGLLYQRPPGSMSWHSAGGGKTLAAGGGDGDGAAVGRWPPGSRSGRSPVSPAARSGRSPFSPDGTDPGQQAATAGELRLWDVATRQQIGNLSTGDDAPLFVAFSRDGKTLVTDSDEGEVRLWSVALATGQHVGSPMDCPNCSGPIDSVAFSPNGKVVAAGFGDGTSRLWDVATGQQLGGTITSLGMVNSVAISPDGKTLAIGSNDDTARLWNMTNNQQVGSPLTNGVMVNSVTFIPHGETLATGSGDTAWYDCGAWLLTGRSGGLSLSEAQSTWWLSARTAKRSPPIATPIAA